MYGKALSDCQRVFESGDADALEDWINHYTQGRAHRGTGQHGLAIKGTDNTDAHSRSLRNTITCEQILRSPMTSTVVDTSSL